MNYQLWSSTLLGILSHLRPHVVATRTVGVQMKDWAAWVITVDGGRSSSLPADGPPVCCPLSHCPADQTATVSLSQAAAFSTSPMTRLSWGRALLTLPRGFLPKMQLKPTLVVVV